MPTGSTANHAAAYAASPHDSAAGGAAPVFGFTLNGNNHLNPGFGMITMDRSSMKPHRLPAFDAVRKLRL